MRYRGSYDGGIDLEWSAEMFGYLSIPVFLLGVVFFSFPDLIYTFVRYRSYRMMKPNSEFEEDCTTKSIPRPLGIILKIFGVLLIVLGIIWFGFSEEFYELCFK